ncbi:MAG: type II toxin-antitoxin system HicB family antitoxin, partial [Selenomonadaceae bacterium]|nr:type II toxin-antitoxin system HicB family antitoxin [Selenomonadaceae bacterium]
MKYVYPAIFYRAKEGGYFINFPDVDGAATQADTLYDALDMAEDALNGIMVMWEDFKAGKSKLPMNNR